jgi:hypothetical protein
MTSTAHRVLTHFFIFLAIGVAISLPHYVSAAPVIRTGEEVSLKEDQAVTGDFYALAGTVLNSAAMSGDSYIIAGSVTQNGETASDLVVAAGTLQVHATVGDDLRAVGGQVVIAGRVVGDVAVFAGELTILSTAEIDGDVIFYGGSLDVKGPVKGSVFASGENIRIDAPVGSDVTVTARNEVVFGARSDIKGDLSYRSPKEAVRAIESTVVGTFSRDERITFADEENRPSPIPFFVMLFSGFVMRFLFGARQSAFLTQTVHSFGPAALIGFAAFMLLPIAIILAFVSVLGMVFGFALLFAYLLIGVLSWALAGVFLGGLISRYATGSASYSVMWISIGTAVLYALAFVPIIGALGAFVIALMVFGGFVMRLYELYR